MHFRSLGLLVVTLMLLSSCGGENAGVTTRSDAVSERVLTVLTFAPGEFVFPLDCIGETFQFVGSVTFRDHLVDSGRGLHDNWQASYDPESFTSLTTGDTWVFEPGFTNAGVWFVDEYLDPLPNAGNNHEFIPLLNTTTGQRIRWFLRLHFAMNAAGEIKREYLNFGCTHVR